MKNKSLLVKMIFFGSAFSIIPVLIVGIFSYIQSSNQVEKQVSEAEMQFVQQVNLSIEQTLQTVEHTLIHLAKTHIIEDSLYSPLDATDFQLYNQLKSQITYLQSFDTKVEEVIIINKNQDWIVMNSGLKRYSTHIDFKHYDEMFEMKQSMKWSLINKAEYEDNISNESCPFVVSLIRMLPTISIQKYGAAIANIPACEFKSYISNEPALEKFAIVDDENTIIFHSDRKLIGTKSTLDVQAHNENHNDQGFGQYNSNELDYPAYVTYYTSKYNNWTYISTIPLEELGKQSSRIGWITLWICLLVIGLLMLLVWITTRRIYSPVQKLVDLISSSDQQDMDRHIPEVQYIERHIQRLFDSNDKLNSEIQVQSQQLAGLFVQRLYRGTIKTKEIEEKIRYLNYTEIIDNWGSKAVLSIQIDSLEGTKYVDRDVELLMFAIVNITDELVPASDRLPIVMIDRTVVILLGLEHQSQADTEKELFVRSKQIKQTIEDHLKLKISIGISTPFHDLYQAAKGYDESQEALRYRMSLGESTIIPYALTHSTKNIKVVEYPIKVEHDLIDAIKNGDEQATIAELSSFMRHARSNSQTPEVLELTVVRLLNRLLHIAHEGNMHTGKIGTKRSNIYQEVLSLHLHSLIENWLKDHIVIPMCREYAARRNSENQVLSEKIIELIHSHFDTEYTLEHCAEQLHYNASYLSNVFKKETGQTFSEYLNMYRLSMAKKLLTDTEVPIKVIAEQLKYSNSHNFIRAFKKQEEMTPGQFREKYRKYSE